MDKEWFMKLEILLEKQFKSFLHNSDSDNLSAINNRNMPHHLSSEREITKNQAYKLREDLLIISQEIKEWKRRYEKSKNSNAIELAEKASQQIKKLMNKGQKIWDELYQTGAKYRAIESQIIDFSKQITQNTNYFEDKWVQLETEQELERLRQRRNGGSQ